ncbi:MAG: GTP pyrophosphokinase family protein [Wujia sp.]
MSEIKQRINGFWDDERIQVYENAMHEVVGRLYEISEEMYKKTGSHPIRFVEQRLKSTESIENKLERKGKLSSTENVDMVLNDLAGVRAICFDIRQVYELTKKVKETSQFIVLKEKDYISKPKSNGYQSYHIILGVNGVKVELQLRTILMDAWSSLETILIYKKTTPIPKELEGDIEKFSRWSMKMDALVDKSLEKSVSAPSR